jgi:hypothetical protein
VFCAKGVYAGAVVNIVTINSDKGVPAGVTVKPDCEVVFDAGRPVALTK